MPLLGVLGLSGGPAGALSAIGGVNPAVIKPVITYPANGSLDQTGTVVITSSAFQSEGSIDTHVQSEWELYDQSMSTVVRGVISSTDLTSWEVTGLTQGQTYHARVRYTGSTPTKESEWSELSTFRVIAAPVITFTSNLPSSWNVTAGGSRTFSVSVTDSANPGMPVTSFSYQWYRNGSVMSGYTSTSFNYYNPVYSSDNGNSIYCVVSAANVMGTSSNNSTVCNISVNPNIGCDEIQRIENIKFAGAGGKPGGGTSVWGEYKMNKTINGVDYTDICGVAWDIDSFRAKARDGRCPGGYDLTLEFKMDGGYNYSKIEKQSAGNGNHCYFGISTGWMDVAGNQDSFRFQLIFRAGQQYSQCSDGSQSDIQPQMDDDAMGRISIRKRIYRYQNRP